MADCERVPTEIIDAAVDASEPIARFYVNGGGSRNDLRTDLSHVVEAVLEALINMPTAAPRRRTVVRTPAYVGPERRGRPR